MATVPRSVGNAPLSAANAPLSVANAPLSAANAPLSAPPLRWCVAVARALVTRPVLWPVAVRQVARLAPPRWWRSRPFLPVPTPGYLAFRSQTMYGDSARLPDPDDVVTYLAWCRRFPTAPASGGHPTRTPAAAGHGHK